LTSELRDSGERHWVIEPPGRQEMHFLVAAGDQVEFTPQVREAFERFLEALSDEIEGYSLSLSDKCYGFTKGCTEDNYACVPRAKCSWEVQQPCFIDYQCKIAS
jgi:hypothetical protein